jgi:hypothetical protein
MVRSTNRPTQVTQPDSILDVWRDSDQPKPTAQYACEFCGKKFVRPRTLVSHACEPKRRHQQKDDPWVRIAFQCFLEFQRTLGSAALRNCTYTDFADSAYYLGFVKFGRYVCETNVVEPLRYCRWLLRNHKKLDHWTRDILYEQFLLEWVYSESVDTALERAVLAMSEWAQQQQSRECDYFKYATPARVSFDIARGRITGWMLYASQTGADFLQSLSADQLSTLWPWVDSDRWYKQFAQQKEDFEWARQLCSNIGV